MLIAEGEGWGKKDEKDGAMLVYQSNPVGVEFFSYVNTSLCCWPRLLTTRVKTILYVYLYFGRNINT